MNYETLDEAYERTYQKHDVGQQLEVQVQAAVDVLARSVLRRICEDWAEEGWELHFPDIGQYDYERIVDRIKERLPRDVTMSEFKMAYEFLADRAEKTI